MNWPHAPEEEFTELQKKFNRRILIIQQVLRRNMNNFINTDQLTNLEKLFIIKAININ